MTDRIRDLFRRRSTRCLPSRSTAQLSGVAIQFIRLQEAGPSRLPAVAGGFLKSGGDLTNPRLGA